MTLCTAWVRYTDNGNELIFATDSCLSGGERWHHGVKLFELPRKDCLICFAGDTARTYPLILNLISSLKFDNHISNPNTDITEVLTYLTTLFTDLCLNIKDFGTQSFEDALGDFTFLFGGWSWKENDFLLWKIYYDHESGKFDSSHDYEGLKYLFIGDALETAKDLLIDEMHNNKKVLSGRFDIEPLRVLLKMIRDKNKVFNSIGGAIQLAKVTCPGNTEFFGVMWPSVGGRKTFLGRDVTADNNPSVRFIDPETGDIINEILPGRLAGITEDNFGSHYEFVRDCYPEPGETLKEDLSPKNKQRLLSILKDHAYLQFLKKNKEKVENM